MDNWELALHLGFPASRLILQAIYFAIDLHVSNGLHRETMVTLADVPITSWILGAVWPLVLIPSQELIKCMEIKWASLIHRSDSLSCEDMQKWLNLHSFAVAETGFVTRSERVWTLAPNWAWTHLSKVVSQPRILPSLLNAPTHIAFLHSMCLNDWIQH